MLFLPLICLKYSFRAAQNLFDPIRKKRNRGCSLDFFFSPHCCHDGVVLVIVVFAAVVMGIDRKYNGTLYGSFIRKNKDEDIENDSYTYCMYLWLSLWLVSLYYWAFVIDTAYWPLFNLEYDRRRQHLSAWNIRPLTFDAEVISKHIQVLLRLVQDKRTLTQNSCSRPHCCLVRQWHLGSRFVVLPTNICHSLLFRNTLSNFTLLVLNTFRQS